MKKTIYADNAATTQLDTDAYEAMKPFMTECYANASQPYSFSKKAKEALKDARATIAECINAEPDEIIFTSGGTESNNWVIKESALNDYYYRATITSTIEHHSILYSCEAIERLKYPVAYIRPNRFGVIEPNVLNDFLSDKTRLVSLMFANNEIGSIQPIKDLCKLAHSKGALFHTDAVQAIGHIPIDVKKLDVDMLSASAHKFNGPKGIGFLYCKEKCLQPFHDGGAQEFKMRAGTENVAAIVGMAVALKKNIANITTNSEKLRKISSIFINELNRHNIDFIINGDPVNRLPGNINISIMGRDGESILHMLDLQGICISTGSACDSLNQQISHVIKSIDVPEEYAKGTIRISFGVNNTEQDAIDIASIIDHTLNL